MSISELMRDTMGYHGIPPHLAMPSIKFKSKNLLMAKRPQHKKRAQNDTWHLCANQRSIFLNQWHKGWSCDCSHRQLSSNETHAIVEERHVHSLPSTRSSDDFESPPVSCSLGYSLGYPEHFVSLPWVARYEMVRVCMRTGLQHQLAKRMLAVYCTNQT